MSSGAAFRTSVAAFRTSVAAFTHSGAAFAAQSRRSSGKGFRNAASLLKTCTVALGLFVLCSSFPRLAAGLRLRVLLTVYNSCHCTAHTYLILHFLKK